MHTGLPSHKVNVKVSGPQRKMFLAREAEHKKALDERTRRANNAIARDHSVKVSIVLFCWGAKSVCNHKGSPFTILLLQFFLPANRL